MGSYSNRKRQKQEESHSQEQSKRLRSFRSNHATATRTSKNRSNKQKNNFARASQFFVNFFAFFARLRRENAWFRVLMENVNKQRRNLSFFLNLDVVPWDSTSGGFAYIWENKWMGIVAIKTGRTKILFLSDNLVALSSLNLTPSPNVALFMRRTKLSELSSWKNRLLAQLSSSKWVWIVHRPFNPIHLLCMQQFHTFSHK